MRLARVAQMAFEFQNHICLYWFVPVADASMTI